MDAPDCVRAPKQVGENKFPRFNYFPYAEPFLSRLRVSRVGVADRGEDNEDRGDDERHAKPATARRCAIGRQTPISVVELRRAVPPAPWA